MKLPYLLRKVERVSSYQQPSDESSGEQENPSDEEHDPLARQRKTLARQLARQRNQAMHGKSNASWVDDPRGKYVFASDEPVWRKRLRKVKSEKMTLEGKSWMQYGHSQVCPRRPMPSISVSKDCPSDESVLSHLSLQHGPPQRTLSNLSESSSTFTEIFERAAEEDLFSVDTPIHVMEANSVAETSATAMTDADEATSISSIDSEFFVEGPEIDADCQGQSCSSADTILLNELGLYAQLLMDDLSFGCSNNCTQWGRSRGVKKIKKKS